MAVATKEPQTTKKKTGKLSRVEAMSPSSGFLNIFFHARQNLMTKTFSSGILKDICRHSRGSNATRLSPGGEIERAA